MIMIDWKWNSQFIVNFTQKDKHSFEIQDWKRCSDYLETVKANLLFNIVKLWWEEEQKLKRFSLWIKFALTDGLWIASFYPANWYLLPSSFQNDQILQTAYFILSSTHGPTKIIVCVYLQSSLSSFSNPAQSLSLLERSVFFYHQLVSKKKK